MIEPLTDGLAHRVLAHLGLARAKPSVTYLGHLVAAYGQRVPWESVSRIARRAYCLPGGGCPRWPEIFWEEALSLGTGGTCFESNLAFFSLLRALGFEGYLTINNMSESIGCHTACVVEWGGEQWLADAGYPVYAPLRIDPLGETQASSPWMDYSLTPAGPDEYIVTQSPHARPYAFTLINKPVSIARYRAATIDDYGEQGLFLSRIIVLRASPGHVQRFDSSQETNAVEVFEGGQKREEALGDDPAAALSARFGVNLRVLREAFAALRG
ncbi:MAG TPA: arylamine N-acetyltransferase [Thermoflexales bacterium]|nr:arylamine N-acetyltransferase [Thermoflexales bacterium]